RLYEAESKFDFIYGYVTLEGYSATIGAQKDTGSRATMFACGTEELTDGLKLTFSLPSCATSTPLPTNTPTSLPTATPGCQMSFSDVRPQDYFYEPVRYLYCAGLVSGYSDGTFRPYNNTTRGQLCKIMVLSEGWPVTTNGGPHFSDVPVNSAFYNYIETAYY